jgi:hypothetical protein
MSKKEQRMLRYSPKPGKHKQRSLPVRGRGFALHQQGKLTLVLPDRVRSWQDDERLFRSLMLDREGYAVSIGLPKFFTATQSPADADALTDALAMGAPVEWSIKSDGALCIRSVINGTVVFRTRNSFHGESYGDRMRACAHEHYPALLDPTVLPDLSLHFEFVSPTTRVVLPYAHDDLHVIGGIDHTTLQLLTDQQTDMVAEQYGLQTTRRVGPFATLDEAQTWVTEQVGIEGVVARWNDGQSLLKIKHPEYELAHQARFLYNAQKAWAIYNARADHDQERFLKAFKPKTAAAEQLLMERYRDCQALAADVQTTLVELTALADQHAQATNKSFATIAHSLGVPRSVALLALRAGKPQHAQELLENQWAKDRFGD